MRIRRRPPLPPPQNPDSPLQIQPSTRREENGLHSDGLNVNDPSPSDPIPNQVFTELALDSSSPSSHKTLDARVHDNESGDQGVERDANTVKEEIVDGKKKKKAPPVLMEGSRCSRVNGRGWRCSQQTLIGYSLCEHHLGKGRLRSLNGGSVRVIKERTRKPRINKEKMGTMKARSITSLLGDEADQ